MEYLEGQTLRERLHRDGVLPVMEAIRIVRQLCSAVAQVHARGFVHCDIKPSNVFLIHLEGLPDHVKLLDFGVSIPHGSSQFPGDGQVAGTPSFMAPEQAQGLRDLDHRADQFAVAAIAYEILSGRRAQGDDLGESRLHEPLPLAVVAPWVPLAFDEVIIRALSRDRERRYPSISRFAWALEAAAEHATCESATCSAMSPGHYDHERLPEEFIVARERPSAPPTRVEGPKRAARVPAQSSAAHTVLELLARAAD
jgi:serine/threonine-protein kinase